MPGRAALLAGMLLGSVAPATAQQDTTLALDSIAVVARRADALLRVPLAAAVVAGDDIHRARPGLGLEEALAHVPGVIVADRQNLALGSRITIRGFGARAAFGVRGVRLLVDGIPLTMPDGQSALNALDVGSAERIEVLRGPASLLHGNAAGGVIAVTTRAPPTHLTTEVRGTLGAENRSAQSSLHRTDVRIGATTSGVGWQVNGYHFERAGWRERAAGEQTGIGARVQAALARNTRLDVVVHGVRTPTAQNPGALPRDTAERRPTAAWPGNVRARTGESVEHGQAGARVVWNGERYRVEQSAHVIRRTVANPIPVAVIDLDRMAGGARTQIDRAVHVRGNTGMLTGGIDFEAQNDERVEFANVLGEKGALQRAQTDGVRALAGFTQLLLPLTRSTELSAGLRYDHVRFDVTDRLLADGRDDSGHRSLAAVSTAIGVVHRLDNAISAFAHAATSFQTPTTTELINAPPTSGQCCPSGLNPLLDPERAASVEAGVRAHRRTAAVELIAYGQVVQDALVPYQVEAAGDRTFFRNAGETRHTGVEASATLHPADRLRLRAAYTYTRARFHDDGLSAVAFEGNAVPGVTPHRLHVAALLGSAAGSLEITLTHAGRTAVNDRNDAFDDAWTSVDVRATAALRRGSLRITPYAALLNAFDARYTAAIVPNAFGGRYYEPAPGRSLMIGLTLAHGQAR